MLSILLAQEFDTCSLSLCGLDYFITILEILQVREIFTILFQESIYSDILNVVAILYF